MVFFPMVFLSSFFTNHSKLAFWLAKTGVPKVKTMKNLVLAF